MGIKTRDFPRTHTHTPTRRHTLRDTCTSRQRDRQRDIRGLSVRNAAVTNLTQLSPTQSLPNRTTHMQRQQKPDTKAPTESAVGYFYPFPTSTPSIHLGTEHILILVCSECSWQQLRNYGVLSRHLTPHLQSFVVLIVCPRPRPHPPHHVCPSVRPASQPACLPFCLSRPAFFRASAARSANSLCTSVLAAFCRGSLNVSLSSCSVCCILLCPLSSTRTIREKKAGIFTLCRL